MTKIYKYLRFSTSKQDEQQQELTIDNWLKVRGITATDRYVECASGGKSYDVRKLGELLTSLNESDTIIVSEISRLTRSISDFNSILNTYCKPNKINLIICNLGLEIRCAEITAMTEMQLNMIAGFAQMEKELIQSRTRSGMRVTINNGTKIGFANEKYGENGTKAKNVQMMGTMKQAINKNRNTCESEKSIHLLKALELYKWDYRDIAVHLNDFCSSDYNNTLTWQEMRFKWYNLKRSLIKYDRYVKSGDITPLPFLAEWIERNNYMYI